jgi:hypothetical protein
MYSSIAITDPLSALMLSHAGPGAESRLGTPVRGARRRRRFQHHAALLKRLA